MKKRLLTVVCRSDILIATPTRKGKAMKGYTDAFTVDNIVRETDKAILFDYARERNVWIPKTCVIITSGGIVWVANWIAKRNGVGRFGATRCLVG